MQTSILPLLLAACATSAIAQNTQITFEGSYDQGQTWHGGVMPYSPGNTLEVRARISLVNAGTNTVLGLAGITFMPTLTNFFPSQGDTVLPFSSSDGSGVPENPQSNLGRILPFSSSGMGPASASGLLTHFIDPGNILRFAGANDNPDRSTRYGVSSGQVPLSIAPTSFRTGTDAVVFRYAVQLESAAVAGEWIASVNLNTILAARGSWYRTPAGTGSLLAPVTQETIVPLRIVIPQPGPLALAIFFSMARASRRRRGNA